MTFAAVAAAFLFMACPPPGGTCRRTGLSGDVVRSAWAVVGERSRQLVTAPRTLCPGEEASVSVRLFDPDGVELAFDQSPLVAPEFLFASTTVSFTPEKAGPHRLEATFSAVLGKITFEVEVVPNGLLGAYQRVVSPVPCSWSWPLSDDTIACETNGGEIWVASTDGGSVLFSGRALAVAGDTLWSVAGDELQRREFVDGGLVFTHAARGFSVSSGVSSLHTAKLALRSQPGGGIGRAEVIDGGLVVTSFSRVDEAPFYFEEPDAGLLHTYSRSPCTPEPCSDGRVIVALEDGLIWFQITTSGALEGVDRPWNPLQRRLPRYLLDATWGQVSPTRSSDRLPLWLEGRLDGTQKILVTERDGGLSFTAWPPPSVANVSATHVLLREGLTNTVRIYRRK